MTDLVIENLGKRFESFQALRGISLTVGGGEFVSLLGPSGCGKTTILRIVAGLIDPSEGRILLGERDITWAPIHTREIGLVFQSYALFPHYTVAENVAFGLKRRGVAAAEVEARVNRTLQSVRLDHLASRYPRELSGGQQQRVALARSIIIEPGLLLLDEPLSNLDAMLRAEMGIEIKRLQEQLGITTVFVTHDQAEALSMSDRICLLNQGAITQVATPEEIYSAPASTFVATFMGRANIFRAVCDDADAGGTIRARAAEGGLELVARGHARRGEPVSVAVRQQAIELRPEADGPAAGPNALPGTVSFASYAGSVRHVVVRSDGGQEISVEAPSAALAAFTPRTRVVASWRVDSAIVVADDGIFQ
jgi:spermidine/putrescine ABC transporter ATP-binding subunit